MAATATASTLTEVAQDSFAGGIWRAGSRESPPANSAFDLTNVLLQDDGKPYRRGGSAYKSNTALDGTNPLNLLWDGSFNAGQRTVFATNGKLAVLNGDDSTFTTMLTGLSAGSQPVSAVKVGNFLLIPLPQTSGMQAAVYAGSRKPTSYSTGSVSITSGSRVLTGSGTSWLASVDAGMLVTVAGRPKRYTIQSVDSNTSITLDNIYTEAGVSGAGYFMSAIQDVTLSNALVTPVRPKLASVASRLAYSAGNYVAFSDPNDPVIAYSSGNWLRFAGQVLALATVRETLLVFTTAGMYTVSGLANTTPADSAGNAQWQYQLANTELIAWSHEGIASWAGRAIVPCLDGIWMVDPTSGPRRISDNIRDLYLSYVRSSGYTTGVAAVHNGHYVVPVLNGTTWVDTLVCRLDTTAWTRLAGAGAKVSVFTARRSSPTVLLGGDSGTSSRVLSLPYFQPSTAVKSDHDGTAHTVSITTRDFPAPGDQAVMWKKARLWQEGTVDSGSPTVSVSYQRPQDGSAVALNGSAQGAGASASTVSALSDGSSYSWWGESIKRSRQIGFTVTTSGALSTWVLRRFAVFFRQSGRQ